MTSNLSISVCASQLRENMGLDGEEIIGDLVQLITDAEYEFQEGSFGKDFSGFSRSLGDGNYLIGFNTDQFWSESFRRFTLSHELGHVTIPDHKSNLEKVDMHRSKSEYRSNDRMEREADYFAICFLAPKKAFQHAMKFKDYSKTTILHLSNYFGISPYASVLRFIELTNLACTLVVCDYRGNIEYERRSGSMKDTFKRDFLGVGRVKGTTLTSDFITGNRDEDTCTVSLSEWFDDLPVEIQATESVIELGYNGKYLTLLTPHIGNLDDYLADNSY